MRSVRRNRVAPRYVDLRSVGPRNTMTSEWLSITSGHRRKRIFVITTVIAAILATTIMLYLSYLSTV